MEYVIRIHTTETKVGRIACLIIRTQVVYQRIGQLPERQLIIIQVKGPGNFIVGTVLVFSGKNIIRTIFLFKMNMVAKARPGEAVQNSRRGGRTNFLLIFPFLISEIACYFPG